MSVFKKCMSSLPEVFYKKVFLAAESALNGLVSIWWVLRNERVNEPILWTNINPHLVPLIFTNLAHNRGIMHRDFPIKLLRLKKNYLNNDLPYCRKASLMKIALLPRYFWSNISMSKLFMATSEAYRTSRLEVFCKKGVLKNFANFTGKRLCWSLFLINFIKMRLQRRCFPVKFAKFLRTPIVKNICERLLLACLHFQQLFSK